ncbi:hypothetical protein MBLNU459_g0222t1 [Dothideomycetes sp. NU459]
MPKNPLKGFARRKSSSNVLDLLPEAPASGSGQSTFRVLERPGGKVGFDGGDKLQKRVSSGFMLSQGRGGKSAEDLGASTNRSVESTPSHTAFGVLKRGRGSGGTTLSGSSGYYDNSSSSARYSSSSTLPSSLEAEHEAHEDELFPKKGAAVYNSPTPPSTAAGRGSSPSFLSKTGRAMSFGLRKQPSPTPQSAPPVPELPTSSHVRDRATTISSYASTAIAPRLDATIGSSDFGSDFGNMFEGLEGSRKQDILPPPPALGGIPRSVRHKRQKLIGKNTNSLRQESEPLFPPPRNASRQAHTPSPDPEPRQRPQPLGPAKRYSWASRTSNDGLMSPAYESDLASPRSGDFSMGDSLQAPSAFGRFRPGYQPVPDRFQSPTPDLEEAQSGYYGHQQIRPVSHVSHVSDEDNTANGSQYTSANGFGAHDASAGLRESTPYAESAFQARSTHFVPTSVRHPAVANVADDLSSTGSAGDSQSATPRAIKLEPAQVAIALFDASPTSDEPAGHTINAGMSPRRLTRAQFEQQQRYTNQITQDDDSDQDEEPYDEQDEAERHAEMTRQRRKQEANLAVYRQQMKKVSGGNPSELPTQGARPGLDRAHHSAPGLMPSMSTMSLAPEAEEEDDDVPLGILQAHGFPSKNRPPVHLSGAPPTPGSVAPSVVGDVGGSLPPFARKLPVDPYFGAGLVNPSNREALAYGNSGGSVYGGAPAVQPMQPGGLVGVIAGEERARAARRGSPNAAAGFGAMPMPSNMQMPPMMPRSNSMMSMMGPQMGGPMGGMPPMMSPAEMQTQHQMMQMMAMQHHMMQQMMAMQNGQMPQFNLPQMPGPQNNGNGFIGTPNGAQRPMSIHSNAGRTMSMLNPPAQWNENAQQQRANTMGGNLRPPGYAGSVYDFSLGGPPQGYTPSIAPSERSNVGMPSRYRPVTTDGLGSNSNSRTQTMTSEGPAQAFSSRHNASTPSHLAANANGQQKSTIRVIDKPKGTKAPQPRVEDEDEEEGWAQMRKKKEERKRRNTQHSNTLGELYQSFE